MKKLLIILSAVVFMGAFAGNSSTDNLSGIDILKTKWYKLTHQNSELKIIEDCKSTVESVKIDETDGKFFLVHTTSTGSKTYEIKKCKVRHGSNTTHSKQQIIDLELHDTKSGKSSSIIVKYTGHQSLWFGLSSKVSTDLFASEEKSHVYETVKSDCN